MVLQVLNKGLVSDEREPCTFPASMRHEILQSDAHVLVTVVASLEQKV